VCSVKTWILQFGLHELQVSCMPRCLMDVARAKLLRSTIWRSPSLSLHISEETSRQFALTDKATGQCQCLDQSPILLAQTSLLHSVHRHTPYRRTPPDTQGNTLITQPGEAVTPVSLDKGI
jgi:hypothetical protein